MDTVLRHSSSLCPFLKKTSPATLRSLAATSAPARNYHASPGGGSMSNLQTIARRCPVMGKAMAVQTAKQGKMGFAGLGGIRGFSGTGKIGAGAKMNASAPAAAPAAKKMLHTSASKEARPVDGIIDPVKSRSTCLATEGNWGR
jgi:5-aminolevulinate synthase